MDAAFNFGSTCSPRPTVTSTSTHAAAAGVGYDDGKDRISALPDDLRYDVVSRLPIRDAVHTTTLSKRWCDIWSSAPLVFSDQDMDIEQGPKRVAAVDGVLVSHRGPFRSVNLSSCDLKHHAAELDRWTRILARRGVQDLVFIRPWPRMPIDMALPAGILRCDNLSRLHLGFWEFPDTTNLPNGVPSFPKLRELYVVGIIMADRDLDRMLSSSPGLEKLALDTSPLPPKHVRLLGQNLKCAISYDTIAVEVAVVEAPCLERLVLWEMIPYSEVDVSEDSHVGVRIVQGALALKVLGYLDTRLHQLRFGDNDKVIKVHPGMNESTMCRVSSVEILAIKVNLKVLAEVQMLPNLLRCFLRIEVLHIESAISDKSGEDHIPQFYEELSPIIECVQLYIKKVFLNKFQGREGEMQFLKYLVLRLRAEQMQNLTLVLPHVEKLDYELENKIKGLVGDLLDQEWASEACTVLLLRPAAKLVCSLDWAFDLSIKDPFLLNDGEELFSDIKREDAN